jgi:hypothetical protein
MMRRPAFALATSLAACAVLAAGCGTSPTPQYYTLSVDAPSVATAAAGDLPSIAVGVVTVPDAVDRPQFVVRTGTNEVRLEELHRWAGSLKGALPRVLAENLVRATGNPHVSAYPESASLGADYRVLVDFQRFDGAPGSEVALAALWTVVASNGDVVRSGRANVREPVAGNDYAALVAAYSRGVSQVSGAIAAGIKDLPAKR